MSWMRITLLTVSVASAAVLAGALAQPPGKPARPAPAAPPPGAPAKPPQADPEAAKALDAAIQAIDRNRLKWLETMLWQQVDVQGLLIQSEGIYLAGPDYRLHLNLKVRLGDAAGKMEFVCDGTTLWEVVQFGDRQPEITKREIKSVMTALNGPTAPAQLRDQYLQRWAFAGVAPLLKGLQQRMVFTSKESVKWQGRDMVKLTGTWSPEVAGKLVPDAKAPWPAYLPRQLFLYLDPQTHWPHRLEWWGPSPPRDGDAVLLQMEFRNPKFTEMSPDRCAKVFTYSTKGKVTDQSAALLQEVNAAIQQLKK